LAKVADNASANIIIFFMLLPLVNFAC